MKPTKLQLLLENCEILEFDWNDVESVSFENTYDAVDIDSDGVVTTMKCCQKFYICVTGGGEYSFDNGSSHWTKRLKEGDITHIHIVYGDGSELTYRVEWPLVGHMYYHPHQGVGKTWMDGVHLIFCCKDTKELNKQREEEDGQDR